MSARYVDTGDPHCWDAPEQSHSRDAAMTGAYIAGIIARAEAAEADAATWKEAAEALDLRVTTLRSMLAETGMSDADVQLAAAYRDQQARAAAGRGEVPS